MPSVNLGIDGGPNISSGSGQSFYIPKQVIAEYQLSMRLWWNSGGSFEAWKRMHIWLEYRAPRRSASLHIRP